jgi:hypothetical protein
MEFNMKEYTRYCVQVRNEQAWFDHFICPDLDLAKYKLQEFKKEEWTWNPKFRIVEREIREKVLLEDELSLDTRTRLGI